MHQLKAANNNRWIWGLMAVIFLIFPLCFVIPFAASFSGSGNAGISAIFVLIIGVTSCFPSVIMGGIFIYPAIQEMFVSKPIIAVHPPQARVGDQVKMSYQQAFKKDMQIHKLSFQLILKETARYRRGTNTYTVTHEHVIDEFGYGQRSIRRGEVVADEWQLQIPMQGVPTFKGRNNQLQWYIKVHIDIKGWLNFKRNYEILVLPERVNI